MLTTSTYDQLCTAAREVSLLHGASAVLGWDQETYMPPKGVEHRSRILAQLSGQAHEQFTSRRFRNLLEKAEGEVDDQAAARTSIVKANIEQLRRELDRALKLPKKLVEQNSQAISLGQAAWAKARAASDFASFAPHLERLVGLAQEMASRWGGKNEPMTPCWISMSATPPRRTSTSFSPPSAPPWPRSPRTPSPAPPPRLPL